MVICIQLLIQVSQALKHSLLNNWQRCNKDIEKENNSCTVKLPVEAFYFENLSSYWNFHQFNKKVTLFLVYSSVNKQYK